MLVLVQVVPETDLESHDDNMIEFCAKQLESANRDGMDLQVEKDKCKALANANFAVHCDTLFAYLAKNPGTDDDTFKAACASALQAESTQELISKRSSIKKMLTQRATQEGELSQQLDSSLEGKCNRGCRQAQARAYTAAKLR